MKSYKGIRKYYSEYEKQVIYDIIIIKWNHSKNWYDIETYDGRLSDTSTENQDILGQWAYTVSSAKRKALMDSGFKSKDFEWSEI